MAVCRWWTSFESVDEFFDVTGTPQDAEPVDASWIEYQPKIHPTSGGGMLRRHRRIASRQRGSKGGELRDKSTCLVGHQRTRSYGLSNQSKLGDAGTLKPLGCALNRFSLRFHDRTRHY